MYNGRTAGGLCMTSIPPSIAAGIAQGQQNVALSSIKQSAEADKQFANVIEETAKEAQTVAASSGRGQNLDILV